MNLATLASALLAATAHADDSFPAGTLASRLLDCRQRFALGAAAEQAGKHDDAIRTFSDGASVCPDMRGQFLYGLAVSTAQSGRPGQGCDWLAKAVDAGFWNLAALDQDPALTKIRKLKKYKEAYPSMREKILRAKTTYPAVTRFGAKPGTAVKGVLVLVHPDGGSAEEMLEMFAADAAGYGLGSAAPEGPALVGAKLRAWGDRTDALRRIGEAATLAKREFHAEGKPVYLAGYLDGGGLVLHYLLLKPREVAGAVAVNPAMSEFLVTMAQGGVAAPPVAIVELGEQDKEVHNLRRRYFELLRQNNRMSRLVGGPSLGFVLPGTWRFLFSPNAGG